MKVAIEILSTKTEPSTSNIKALKESLIASTNELSKAGKLKHSYDFYFYYGGFDLCELDANVKTAKDKNYDNCYDFNIAVAESIYDTYEKGIEVLKYIKGYDWYVRINISCLLNIKLLDVLIEQFDKFTVYCNAINSYINDEMYYNDLYPRGDMMIFSSDVREGILANADKYIRCDTVSTAGTRLNIPHVDDCLFGLCLIDYFGKDYYKHLKMLIYNYLPKPVEVITDKYSLYCVGNRVKTVPPGISYSGYSWNDNEYRRFDGKKMKFLNEQFIKINYDKVLLKDLISEKRETLFVQLSSQPISIFNKYLEIKRR